MSIEVDPATFEMSRNASEQFFRDPASYSEFTPTEDGRDILGCIHPTPKADTPIGKFKVMRQMPGGLIGLGTVIATSEYAVGRYGGTICDGMRSSTHILPNLVGDAHYTCAYDANKGIIIPRAAYPDDRTAGFAEEYAYSLGIADLYERNRNKVQDGFKRVTETLVEVEALDLHSVADEIHPEHDNVYAMRQPNMSRTWIDVLDPTKSKDTNKKPLQQLPIINGYVTTPAANRAYFERHALATRERVGMLICAMVNLDAATKATITDGKENEFIFLQVNTDPSAPYGISIEEKQY